MIIQLFHIKSYNIVFIKKYRTTICRARKIQIIHFHICVEEKLSLRKFRTLLARAIKVSFAEIFYIPEMNRNITFC